VLTLGLSVRYKAPVMMAWCTPGAALMAGMSGISLNEAVAGFIFAGGPDAAGVGGGLVRPLGAPDSGFAGGGDVGRYFD
jgi:predicted benzoate:H+ symporter BenE